MASFLILMFIFLLASSPQNEAKAEAEATTKANPHLFSKIYAFGDSFTDTGNTRSATGPYSFGYVSQPPYGTTFFHRPTNRYSDGRLVIDFVAAALSLPFLPPDLGKDSFESKNGINFAVAGSTAIEHEFFLKNNISIDLTPQSLMTQLGWFNSYLKRKGCVQCEEETEDALFWVGEIGVNDYAYSFASSVSPEIIQDLAVKNVHLFLEALLNNGAKYIVVQGLPLTGCLPLTLTLADPDDRDGLGCAASVNNRIRNHNRRLQAQIQELQQQHPGSVISYADYLSAHETIMKNPASHGFTEPFKVCCGTGGGPYNFELFATCGSPDVSEACSQPRKYVNWDGVHLTEAMYQNVANMFLNQEYCRPPFEVLLKSVNEQR